MVAVKAKYKSVKYTNRHTLASARIAQSQMTYEIFVLLTSSWITLQLDPIESLDHSQGGTITTVIKCLIAKLIYCFLQSLFKL